MGQLQSSCNSPECAAPRTASVSGRQPVQFALDAGYIGFLAGDISLESSRALRVALRIAQLQSGAVRVAIVVLSVQLIQPCLGLFQLTLQNSSGIGVPSL